MPFSSEQHQLLIMAKCEINNIGHGMIKTGKALHVHSQHHINNDKLQLQQQQVMYADIASIQAQYIQANAYTHSQRKRKT